MVTLHEVITFLVSMQISISSLQTHNVNRCGRSRHLARKRSEERFSRNAETELVCRLLLEKKNELNRGRTNRYLKAIAYANPEPRVSRDVPPLDLSGGRA